MGNGREAGWESGTAPDVELEHMEACPAACIRGGDRGCADEYGHGARVSGGSGAASRSGRPHGRSQCRRVLSGREDRGYRLLGRDDPAVGCGHRWRDPPTARTPAVGPRRGLLPGRDNAGLGGPENQALGPHCREGDRRPHRVRRSRHVGDLGGGCAARVPKM
jgi:hypothetical protein